MEVTWTEPTLTDDGSALTDLAGVYVYRSQTTGTYALSDRILDTPASSPTGGQTVTVIAADPTSYGTYFYVATAYDTSGLESVYSTEVQRDFLDQLAPGAPSGLSIQ